MDRTNSLIGTTLKDVGALARRQNIKLFTATDGNHGRAIARMGKLTGLKAYIYVPLCMDQHTQILIESEGAQVIRVEGDYDLAVRQACIEASRYPEGILVQDTAFAGYEEIPRVWFDPSPQM